MLPDPGEHFDDERHRRDHEYTGAQPAFLGHRRRTTEKNTVALQKNFQKASIAVGIGKIERSLIVVHSGWFLQRVIHHSGDEMIIALLGRGETAGLAESVLATPAER